MLVVDDVEANLVAITAVLDGLDCNIVQARSGNEALRLLLKQTFVALLLDVQMPQMDGFEVASHVRSHAATKDLPILFLTAKHDTEDDVLRGYGTGAVDFLFKPISPVILRSKSARIPRPLPRQEPSGTSARRAAGGAVPARTIGQDGRTR